MGRRLNAWSRLHDRLPKGAFDPAHPVRSLARWPLWLASIAVGKPVTVRFATGGLMMRLVPRLRTFGSTSIFIRRDYYEPELRFIRRFVKPGSVAIDIGGSFGVFSLFMAHYAGERGHVFTFEPGHFSYAELSHNVQLNAMEERITLFNVAASDRAASLQLVYTGDAPVTFSIGDPATVQRGSEAVGAERVDKLVPPEDWARVSFIKIDVEGYEKTALEGARGIIEAARPTIMFEVSSAALARQGLTPADMAQFLGPFGYSFYKLGDDDTLVPITELEDANIFAVA